MAQYTAQHLPETLKANSLWTTGDFAKAIEETFLEFDDLLRLVVIEDLKLVYSVFVFNGLIQVGCSLEGTEKDGRECSTKA